MKTEFLTEDQLDLNDPPIIRWVLAQNTARLVWRDNPKLHDIGAIIQSVERYGFQEPAKFDGQLLRIGQEDGADPLGAIKSGNGRTEAVAAMEHDGRYPLPRGCASVKEGGAWAVPMLFGTDAKSQGAARAYAIDANNLTMSGGNFDGFDMSRMWEPTYLELLQDLPLLPVSVDGDMLDVLLGMDVVPSLDDLEDEFGEPDPTDGWPFIRVCVSPNTLNLWNALMEQIDCETDDEQVRALIGCVNLDAL